jgi:superfamily II DNA or RNA helicase
MKIEVQGSMAWIVADEPLDDEVLEILDEQCSFMPSKAKFIEEAVIRNRRLSGDDDATFDREKLRYNMFNRINLSFPAGLCWTVKDILFSFDIKSKVEFNFPIFISKIPIPIDKLEKLWEHQFNAIALACKEPRGIYALPTASGKTCLGVELWELRGKPLGITLAPTNNICDQWVDEFQKYFPKHTIGKWFRYHKSKIGNMNIMTFAKADSILTNLKNPRGLRLLKKVPFVLVDECHGIGAGKYGKPNKLYQTIMQLDHLQFIYGLSATPQMRSDEAENIYQTAAIGEILLKISTEELREKGILSPEKVEFIPIRPVYLRARKRGTEPVMKLNEETEKMEPVMVRNKKTGKLQQKLKEKETKLQYFQYQYNTAIVNNDDRNIKIVKRALKYAMDKRQVLIFVKTIEHMNLVFNRLDRILKKNQFGLSVAYTHGEDNMQLEKIQGFKQNEINILVVTPQLMGMGINIPQISGIVNGVAVKSLTVLNQMIGRGRRTHRNKFDCMVSDFADGTEPFSNASIIRLRHHMDEGAETDISQCRWLDNFI